MADVNPTLPEIDELNATADPKIRTALATLIATVNDLEAANLSTALLNSLARLKTPANVRIAYGSATSAAFAQASAGSPYSGDATVAHGLGSTPVLVLVFPKVISVQVPAAAAWLGNGSAHAESIAPEAAEVSKDATNVVFRLSVKGYVTNNTCDFYWLAIG